MFVFKEKPRSRGFTAMELMVVLIIMAIVATIGCDTASEFEAAARPDRAAKECGLAFQYARQLAMTSGKNTKVTFDTTANAFSVYWMSNGTSWDATPVANPMAQGGVYTITMNSASEINGNTISLSPAGTTAFTYNSLGNLDNATTVTFQYGGKSKTLNVYRTGDPQVN